MKVFLLELLGSEPTLVGTISAENLLSRQRREDEMGLASEQRATEQIELCPPARKAHPLSCHNLRVPDGDAMHAICLRGALVASGTRSAPPASVRAVRHIDGSGNGPISGFPMPSGARV